MIELELPWPPSVNHYKIMGRYNTPATKTFYADVWVKVCQENATKAVKSCFKSTIDLEVILTLHPPDKRRRDIDNGIKLILDSLQRSGLIADDYQISRLTVERRGIVKQGKVIVRIKEYAHK